MGSCLELARAVAIEPTARPAFTLPAAVGDAHDIDDIDDQSPGGGRFLALRALYVEGGLDGYGPFALPDGSAVVFDLAGYVRRRLLDTDDPRLADEAARRLSRVAAALRPSAKENT
jgi:hypothetical protein